MSTHDENLHPRDDRGRFANKEHGDPSGGTDALNSDKSKQFVEHMISTGRFSPAARDMDVRDVIDQYCESHVETFERKAQMYEAAGVLMRGKPEDLISGDLVDLEPLLRQYGDPDAENFETDLMASQFELAEVDTVVLEIDRGPNVAVIYNFQTNIAVPADTDINYIPSMDTRCAACGDEVRDEDFVGDLCEDCADDQRTHGPKAFNDPTVECCGRDAADCDCEELQECPHCGEAFVGDPVAFEDHVQLHDFEADDDSDVKCSRCDDYVDRDELYDGMCGDCANIVDREEEAGEEPVCVDCGARFSNFLDAQDHWDDVHSDDAGNLR